MPSATSAKSHARVSRGRVSGVARMRSPLRYPGGKSRAVADILRLIPPGVRRLGAPFIGGASVEIACTERGIRVFGYDAFAPLVDFWQAVLDDASRVGTIAWEYFPLSRERFYKLQKNHTRLKVKPRRAAAFYALNRASFSGTTLSGGMSPDHPRWTESAIARLCAFDAPLLSVAQKDFRESLRAHEGDFLYLDPPYMNGQKLYGARGNTHEGFDHAALADIVRGRAGWILSYNDCQEVRRLYEGHKILTPSWAWGMGNRKVSGEIFVLSADLASA